MSEIQRVAIVTGAAGGIGRAMTQGLLAAGIRVTGVDRDREPLEALAASYSIFLPALTSKMLERRRRLTLPLMSITLASVQWAK